MATIGVVSRSGEEPIRTVVSKLQAWAQACKHDLLYELSTANHVDCKARGASFDELTSSADPVVVLGGDGTMIKVARHVGAPSPLLIGVNFGSLGFLTEIAPEELIPVLQACLAGDAKIGVRQMLYCQVLRGSSCIFSSQAVNDVVIQKGLQGRLVDFDVYADGEAVMRLRADGVIFATPTGSTAYSLAAGGSIVHPDLAAMLITPICAHALTIRPLLLPLEAKLSLAVPQHEGEVLAVIDGQQSLLLNPGDQVLITKAKHTVACVRSPGKSYFGILQSKLHWGVANRGD